VVVAPSLIPRKPGDRIKTDPRDAANLARLHPAGELTPVGVPDLAHEAVRDLARLQQEHPGLVVELVLSNRTEDLLRRDADIAARMVRPAQEALVARRLGEIELGLHAHRDYLNRCGAPAALDDLRADALIGFDPESAFIRDLRARGGTLHRGMFTLLADSDLAQLAAIRAGCGIGVCQVGLARRDAGLVRVLPAAFSVGLETWLAMHEDLRASRRCRVAYDALAAGLSDYIASAE
jgi:DNA-binding transcriptional LysR family regulator